MGFSLTVMALLARLQVLVQQVLLYVVSLFNMVSSISIKKQSIKVTHKGIEETVEVDVVAKEDPCHVDDMKIDLLTGPLQINDKVTICCEEGKNHGSREASINKSSLEVGLHSLPPSSTNGKLHSCSKTVVFVSIKTPTLVRQSVPVKPVLTTNLKAFNIMGNESETKDGRGDSLASIFTDVNAKGIFEYDSVL
ncbi:hypothetical protein RJT34_25956 [Clitoria ternatea]|uniref:Uncharacterized protein n=1 Tax=Clitoria ternatea TaxID=43366 RepID=A0AAN9FAT1_CLITE